MEKKERRELYVYNAYGSDGGLFGLHNNEPEQVEKCGLDFENYEKLQEIFGNLCDRLGDRTLSRMSPENAIVTPSPVSKDLAECMNNILGYSELPLFCDVGGVGAGDLCSMVLENDVAMDKLANWVRKGAKPVLMPRTHTPSSIILAKELKIDHIHKPPNWSNLPEINGVYPTLEYVENNLESKNNSKVLNYKIQKEIDIELGQNYVPEGEVAYDIDGVLEVISNLESVGINEFMVKADLSVDGMGNLHIDNSEKVKGVPFRALSYQDKANYISRILKERSIPLGSEVGVVVTEFLANKVSDPSVEIYCPPKEWNLKPFIYYSCDMIMKDGGFAGSIIPNVPMGLSKNLYPEYHKILGDVRSSVLEFAQRKWDEGYVGIMDCDLGICKEEDNSLSVKILEYNLSRETGGTASYHLWEKLGRGFVIARDSVRGEGFACSIEEMQDRFGHLLYKKNGFGSGAIILGHRIEKNGFGDIMSLVYSDNLPEALYYDCELQKCALIEN